MSRSIAIGYHALASAALYATNNIAIGYDVLSTATSPSNSIAIGDLAAKNVNELYSSIIIGRNANRDTENVYNSVTIGLDVFNNGITQNRSILIGDNVATKLAYSTRNILLGTSAGENANEDGTLEDSILLGRSAGRLMSGSYLNDLILIGNGAGLSNRVGGTIAIGNRTVQLGSNTGRWLIAIGNDALNYNESGDANVAIGDGALLTNTSGYYNIGIGFNALTENTIGHYNLAAGVSALEWTKKGNYNIALGPYSMQKAYADTASLNYNIAVGYETLHISYSNVGNIDQEQENANIAIGHQANKYTATNINSNIANIAIGNRALYTGAKRDTIAIGHLSLSNLSDLTGATQSIAIGKTTLYSAQHTKNTIAVGHSAMYYPVNISESIAIGHNSMYSASSHANYNIGIGNETLMALKSTEGLLSSGVMNVAIGYQSMQSSSDAKGNVSVGYKSQQKQIDGDYNISVGWEAFNAPLSSSNYNVVLGASAGYKPKMITTSVLVGYKSLYATDQTETAINSVHVGPYSSEHLEESVENVAIGSYTLWGDSGYSTSLKYNTVIGTEAGRYLRSGSSYNIALGYKSAYMRGANNELNTFASASNIISIGNYTAVSQSNLDSVILVGTNVLKESDAGTVANGLIKDTIFIGHNAAVYSNNESANTHTLNIAIGNLSQEHIINSGDAYNITIGNKSLRKNNNTEHTGDNIVIGHEAAESASMQHSIAVGNLSQKWVYGKYNVSIGQSTFKGYNYEDTTPILTQSRNVFVGDEIALSSIAMVDNVAIGYQSMANSTKLSRHIAIGPYSLNNADNNLNYASESLVSSSIAIGYKSLYEYTAATNNTLDGANISIGEYSLGDVLHAKDSIALGFEAARGATETNSNQIDKSISVGSYNLHKFEDVSEVISVGYKGLYNFVSGSDIISLGNRALYNYLSGSVNLALGTEALYTNKGGIYNIGIGYRSLYSSSANLSNNIAVGVESQYYNFANNEISTNASGNISYGHYSLRNISYGYGNVAFGYKALYGNATLTQSLYGPNNNIAIGNYALYNSDGGTENIAIGSYALQNAGSQSFYNIGIGGYSLGNLKVRNENDEADRNIAIGYRALHNKASGSSDIVIGRMALNTTASNANVVIGHNSGMLSGSYFEGEYGDLIDISPLRVEHSILIGTSNSVFAYGSSFRGVISLGSSTLANSNVLARYDRPISLGINSGIIAVGNDTLSNQKSGSLTGIIAIGHRIAPQTLKGSLDASLLIGNNTLEAADLSGINNVINIANVVGIGHNVARVAKFFISTQSFSEGNYYGDESVLTAVGYHAFYFASSSTSNLGIGSYVGANLDGKFNLFIGNSTGYDAKGDNNVVIGNESFNLGVGIIADNIINTPRIVTTGTRTVGSNNNTVIGNYTLRNALATNVTSIGYNNLDTGYTERLGESKVAGLTYYVSSVPSQSTTATDVITIGNRIGRYAKLVSGSIFVGDSVGGDVHGFQNIIAIGNYALGAYEYQTELALVPSVSDGTSITHSNNITIGNYSSYHLKDGLYNTAIGNYAYFNAYDRIGNSVFGNESGYHLGEYERIIGESVECGTGNYNTFGGYLSGWAIGKQLAQNIIAVYQAPLLPGQFGPPVPPVYYELDITNAAGTPEKNTIFGADALPNLYNACMPFPTFTALSNSQPDNDAFPPGVSNRGRQTTNPLYNFAKNAQHTSENDPLTFSDMSQIPGLITTERGNLNVAVGYKAGFELVAGGKNVYIGAGAEAGVNAIAGWENKETKNGPEEYRNGNNNIVIGYYAHKSDPIISNEITIGNPDHTAARLVGQMGAWLYPSDARDKTDTGSFTVGLDFIKSLQPKTYKWDSRYNYPSGSGSNGAHTSSNYFVGFIAQDFYQSVQDHVPVDYRAPWINLAKQPRKDGSEYYDVLEIAPTLTIVPLVNAVKELSRYVTGSVTGSYTGSFTGSVSASSIVVDSLYQKSNNIGLESKDQLIYSNTLSKVVVGYTSGSNATGSSGTIRITTGSLVSASITYPDLIGMSGIASGIITATQIDSGSAANVYRYNLITKYEAGVLSIVTASLTPVYTASAQWNVDFKLLNNQVIFATYGQLNTEITWTNDVEFNYTNIIRRSNSTGCTSCDYSEALGFSSVKIIID